MAGIRRDRPLRRPRPGVAGVVPLLLVLAACGDGPGDAGAVADSAAVDTGAPARAAVPVDTAEMPAAVTGPGDAVAHDSGPGGVRMTGYDTVFAYFTTPAETRTPAARPVPDTAMALRAAFAELLRGPTAAERDSGLLSWFSDETAGMLRDVSVEDGFAVVDFGDLRPVIPNAVGSAGALMLMGELTATAFQFPGIRRVEFRIEGSCEALMAWLQFGCYPITRDSWDPPAGFRTAVAR